MLKNIPKIYQYTKRKFQLPNAKKIYQISGIWYINIPNGNTGTV